MRFNENLNNLLKKAGKKQIFKKIQMFRYKTQSIKHNIYVTGYGYVRVIANTLQIQTL